MGAPLLQEKDVRHGRHPFERALLARARRLFAGAPCVVVGVSGGPDSTALLVALAALASPLGVGSIVAAHLDHGLRGEAARADRDFVLALATRLGCRFEEGRASDLQAAARGRGIEAAARETRYEFLLEVAERTGSPVVAVAHTATDQAETVLLRALRGAGLRGLSAMPEQRRLARGSRVRLARPLLHASRADVIAYLASKDVEARDDAMNADRRYARARVRHELLPIACERLNPRAEEALGRVAEAARAARRLLEREARELLERAGGRAPVLARAPEPVLEVALARLVRAHVPARLARVHVRALVRLVRSSKDEPLGPVALPEGLEARLEGETLVIGEPSLAPGGEKPFEPIALPVPGHATDAEARTVFEARVVPAGEVDPSQDDPARVAHLDLSRAQGPLAVRRRRAGDRFFPLGSSGTTTLKHFFVDRKVPRALRARVPIVTLADRPIWVVGYRIDDRLKVTPATEHVLEVRALPAGGPGDPS